MHLLLKGFRYTAAVESTNMLQQWKAYSLSSFVMAQWQHKDACIAVPLNCLFYTLLSEQQGK